VLEQKAGIATLPGWFAVLLPFAGGPYDRRRLLLCLPIRTSLPLTWRAWQRLATHRRRRMGGGMARRGVAVARRHWRRQLREGVIARW